MTTNEDRKMADVRPMAQRITEWDLITQGHIPTAMSKHIATALLAALDRVDELERVSRTARQAVYHCTLATGIGYWQELANAVFELEADDRPD